MPGSTGNLRKGGRGRRRSRLAFFFYLDASFALGSWAGWSGSHQNVDASIAQTGGGGCQWEQYCKSDRV
jgi:hypothetical protein